MDYNSAIDFLYNSLPAFEKGGAGQYKPGLDTARALSAMFGNPHQQLRCIHIAGTNGKGSTASTLAAILSAQGLKVGLYTSPHIFTFEERIRINGEMIPQQQVVDFVDKYLQSPLNAEYSPTFFELTTIMALDYFAREKVDIAVIETGLGGRLDTTNIITPELSIITNISLDHTDLLGDTIEKIAAEKAGIIKPGVPVVIGEALPGSPEREVFSIKAHELGSPIYFAQDYNPIVGAEHLPGGRWLYTTRNYGTFEGELSGDCQVLNTATVLTAIDALNGLKITDKAVADGFGNVSRLTGLIGRWTQVATSPTIIIDTAHNPGGWIYNSRQLAEIDKPKHIILGFVADKDVDAILDMLPCDATYYFTTAGGHRALSGEALIAMAERRGLKGECYADVNAALDCARKKATANDFIFIGGSNYLISQLSLRD